MSVSSEVVSPSANRWWATRTMFWATLLAPFLIVGIVGGLYSQSPKTGSKAKPTKLKVAVFNKEGKLVGPFPDQRVEMTPAEWKKKLGPEAFKILRKSATEKAFCGMLTDVDEPGVYACEGCGLPLFSSDAKFHSGSGWPSFFKPIAPTNLISLPDLSHGMDRIEIRCARCEGHLGHVFDDGPRPTGLRFCLNSAAMKFVKSDDVATLADPIAEKYEGKTATAVMAGGCFWCTEAAFEQFRGVIDVQAGYAGGDALTANYNDVSTGTTKHAEAIRITYVPEEIDYAKLLDIFFDAHDPTTKNRQGNDVGPQYRSAIFFANQEEKAAAESTIKRLNDAKAFPKKIVTTLEPLVEFYPAEDHHQDFVANNPKNPYVKGHSIPRACKVRDKYLNLVDAPVNDGKGKKKPTKPEKNEEPEEESEGEGEE